jgi:hypothetical protein
MFYRLSLRVAPILSMARPSYEYLECVSFSVNVLSKAPLPATADAVPAIVLSSVPCANMVIAFALILYLSPLFSGPTRHP